MSLQIIGGQDPQRNRLCPCGSGLKYKWCHGDPLKKEVCNRVANEKMFQLIHQEKKKRGLIEPRYLCENCGHKFDEPDQSVLEFMDGGESCPMCPNCQSINFVEVN